MLIEDAKKTIEYMALQNDKAILFHSLTGKDSIVLLDLMSKKFSKIYCIYMYWVKDLSITKPYENAVLKYGNTEIIQVPYIDNLKTKKAGLYEIGIKNIQVKNIKNRSYEEYFKYKFNTPLVAWGMKRDSFHRIGMYNKASKSEIHFDYDKYYPIVNWNNKQCHSYIKFKNLIKPLNFGKNTKSSSICESPFVLNYIKEKYPLDYLKIIKEYPLLDIHTENYNYEY